MLADAPRLCTVQLNGLTLICLPRRYAQRGQPAHPAFELTPRTTARLSSPTQYPRVHARAALCSFTECVALSEKLTGWECPRRNANQASVCSLLRTYERWRVQAIALLDHVLHLCLRARQWASCCCCVASPIFFCILQRSVRCRKDLRRYALKRSNACACAAHSAIAAYCCPCCRGQVALEYDQADATLREKWPQIQQVGSTIGTLS
eukprot:1797740-Pleurochrysis_carterae.AAC.1